VSAATELLSELSSAPEDASTAVVGGVGGVVGVVGVAGVAGVAGVGGVGQEGTRLLAGPRADEGPESWESHLDRLGPLPHAPAEQWRALVTASGLTGRGGGAFPLAGKLDLAARSPGVPIVVVNGSEGEPASRKDQTLLGLRPHLVLDGAEIAAAAAGAAEVVVYLHHGRPMVQRALERAVAHRLRVLPAARPVRISCAPDRYVSGESSAVVSHLEGRGARPRRLTRPVAASGVGGRPTVVSNTETFAHLGLLARGGAEWFRRAGSPAAPGSSLLTLTGDVCGPGQVVEVVSPVPLSAVLSLAGVREPPRAVLLGGYAGTWVDGWTAWGAPVDRDPHGPLGRALGCGLVGVLAADRCGVAETARLASYLAGESAGQCGPCAFGLPALAEATAALALAGGTRGRLRRLHDMTERVHGRGACGHPDGAVRLVESALDVFGAELRAHRRRRCAGCARPRPSAFPLPAPLPSGAGWQR
jgi:NADH:ubiquinone oxidoreductase subunit F (NADH-binding)